MRVALKIAYDGRSFYGHQRQPSARTVEGECLAALKAAGILTDPQAAFFRSASRTDRGVSAVGNVIAFDAAIRPDAVLGAFNGKSHDVWAWAFAAVADGFHPRQAEERWYRYHLLDPPPVEPMRQAGRSFEGEHDFRWFTSDPRPGTLVVRRVEVTETAGATLIDVSARSFRRGMVRRMVAAMVAVAAGEIRLEDIEAALAGVRHDFGTIAPEPLVLMDVRYPFAFTPVLKPKVVEEWARIRTDLALRVRWLDAVAEASSQHDTGAARDPSEIVGLP